MPAGLWLGVGLIAVGSVGLLTGALGRARARARARGGREPSVPAWIAACLDALDLRASPEQLRSWLAWAGVALSAWAVAAAPWLALPAIVLLAVVGIRRSRRGGHEPVTDALLVDTVEALVAALRSGSSLGQAVEEVATEGGPPGVALAGAVSRLRAGAWVVDALEDWAGDVGGGSHLVLDAVSLAAVTGGGQADALDAVADTLRRRDALAREVRALASQARASAMVLVGAPIAFAGVVALADPRVGRFLLASAAGWACLAGGFALDLAGGYWMHVLARRVS